MDNYRAESSAAGGALSGEYAALADARRVMAEVLELVEDLHRAATRLGDALVAAGLPAREWRGPDCRLLLLSDQFPDVTLDDLVTRLAEFAAGMGPHWLRGGPDDVARFNDEATVLYEVARPLRVVAQRMRMLPARERGDYPLERALGDARVGTPLDRATTILRDLASLGPYIQPLTPEEWAPPTPQPTAQPTSRPAHPQRPVAAGAPPMSAPVAAQGQTGDWLVGDLGLAAGAAPNQARPAENSQALAFRRLRDFMPPAGSRPVRTASAMTGGFAWSRLPARSMALAGTAARWLQPRKWLVVGAVAMLLALATALVTLASQPPHATSALTAQPARLTFTCTGKGAIQTVKLHDDDSRPLSWTITPPPGLALSVTHGALQPSAFVMVTVQVKTAKAATGTLAFTSNDGGASVPYTVTCK